MTLPVPAPSLAPIPQPPPRPLLRNAPDVGIEQPVQRLMALAEDYGPIFKLEFPGRSMLVLSSHALVDELCDTRRFEKALSGPLREIRALAGDGLFTAENHEPNWGRAHRLLAPAFGPLAMEGYFDRMRDIAEQMFDKWERLGPQARIDVPDAMTRLTLDTIALCGFDTRLNSFYRDDMHPFIGAMVRALREANTRSTQFPVQHVLRFQAARGFQRDIAEMNRVVDEVIAARRAGGAAGAGAPDDLLARMLTAIDPVTGEGLDDTNIRYQIVTFLIAGHETTSGLLSFAVHHLLEHPEVMARARAEVDRVIGGARPQHAHLRERVYIDQILRETLRIWPTAPAFALHAKAPTTLGGRYAVTPDDTLVVLVPSLHRDPEVWDAPARFDPDRFAPERRAALPANAWKPFGHGQRACIGRLFAMQEATLVLAMLLQRFEAIDGFGTPLEVKETLTLKPARLHIRVQRRPPAPETGTALPPRADAAAPAAPAPAVAHDTPLTVLYGSNTGTAEALARRLAETGGQSGYRARVLPMDEAVDNIDTETILVVVTASYNGQPPDNARAFCGWLDTLPDGALRGLRAAVLGCGHRDWAQTFQAVPQRVEAALLRLGATLLAPRGALDGAADLVDQAARWRARFWPAAHAAAGLDTAVALPAAAPLELDLVSPHDPLAAHHGLREARVVAVRELVDMGAPFARSKREVVLALPDDMDWSPGQHLAVLGENPAAEVVHWLAWLDLPGSTLVRRRAGGGQSLLPTDRALALEEVLARYVDLGQPAGRRLIQAAHDAVRCPPERGPLRRWLDDDAAFQAEVVDARLRPRDLLARCPSVRLPLATLLDLLPPMQPRRYSISSSPREQPRRCRLTVAWVRGPATGSTTGADYEGVASGTLARARAGQPLWVAVRSPPVPFALPADPATPVLMIAAGTGIAPFRGFLAERAEAAAAGQILGPAHLFFGCDHPEVDLLYRDSLRRWEAQGTVQLHTAFFHQPDGPVHFVQHRLWADRAAVGALLDAGAVVYLCGDGARMAPAVRATLGRILATQAGGDPDRDGPAALAALEAENRLQMDIFGG